MVIDEGDGVVARCWSAFACNIFSTSKPLSIGARMSVISPMHGTSTTRFFLPESLTVVVTVTVLKMVLDLRL